MPKIHITPSGLEKIRQIRRCQGKEDWGLRIHIKGGGICAGFEYLIALDNDPEPTDMVCPVEELTVYLSPESAEFVEGATIDYKVTPEGEGFVVDLPPREHACCCERTS